METLLRREAGDLAEARVLEIGCGTGYFTSLLEDLGVRSYAGCDVTDVLFPDLRARFPHFRFQQKDVTSEPLNGLWDVVLMIDVLEHIVDEQRLSRALENVRRAVRPSGLLLLGPVTDSASNRRRLFYVRLWSSADVRPVFRDDEVSSVSFVGGSLLTIRKSR